METRNIVYCRGTRLSNTTVLWTADKWTDFRPTRFF